MAISVSPPVTATRRADEGVREAIGYIAAVEGLRGVAVLWVMLFHYCVVRSTGARDPWIATVDASWVASVVIRNGYLGVDLFFLITGFLLTLPWFRNALQDLPAPAAAAFYERRVRRIVPAYYVQLAMLFFVFVPLLRGLDYWRQDLWFLLFNLGAHLSFLHYTTPFTSASLSINGPLWTLALEAQYYLLLPLIAPLFVRWPLRTAAAMVGVAAGWRWLSLHDLETLVQYEMRIGSWWNLPESTIRQLVASQLPGYLGHFALGIVAGRAWLHWRDARLGVAPRAAAAVTAAAALIVLYWLYAAGGAVVGPMAWLVSVASMAIAMAALVSTGLPLAGAVLGNPALAFVGKVSYSAYLYHLPLLLLANHAWPALDHWGVFPVYIATVLALSWVSYRCVEAPFMRRATRGVRVSPLRAP